MGEAYQPAGDRPLRPYLLRSPCRPPCHRRPQLVDVGDGLSEHARHGRRLTLLGLDLQLVVADPVEFSDKALEDDGADRAGLMRIHRGKVRRRPDSERMQPLCQGTTDSPYL